MTHPWKNTVRRETGLVEHVCEHGVGHPAVASADYMAKKTNDLSWDVHGCDGCCGDPEWKLADLREGVHVANNIIIRFQKEWVERVSDPKAGI